MLDRVNNDPRRVTGIHFVEDLAPVAFYGAHALEDLVADLFGRIFLADQADDLYFFGGKQGGMNVFFVIRIEAALRNRNRQPGAG